MELTITNIALIWLVSYTGVTLFMAGEEPRRNALKIQLKTLAFAPFFAAVVVCSLSILLPAAVWKWLGDKL